MKVCIIPARGGSKRIPRKNIRDFRGKPMIAWSIEAAIASACFDRIIVSTDDQEVTSVAKAWGAEVPFARPAELAGDNVATLPVVAHATEWALKDCAELEAVCCLYPTAPFVHVSDLSRGVMLLQLGDWDYCFTVTSFETSIFRSFIQDSAGGLQMLFPEHYETRSQDLPVALHDAGQFYWGTPSAWLTQEAIFGPRSRPLLVPRWRVNDIDTEDDWHRAELLARALWE